MDGGYVEMIKTNHYCDRCGKSLINYDLINLLLLRFSWAYDYRKEDVELCKQCYKSFKIWLRKEYQ